MATVHAAAIAAAASAQVAARRAIRAGVAPIAAQRAAIAASGDRAAVEHPAQAGEPGVGGERVAAHQRDRIRQRRAFARALADGTVAQPQALERCVGAFRRSAQALRHHEHQHGAEDDQHHQKADRMRGAERRDEALDLDRQQQRQAQQRRGTRQRQRRLVRRDTRRDEPLSAAPCQRLDGQASRAGAQSAVGDRGHARLFHRMPPLGRAGHVDADRRCGRHDPRVTRQQHPALDQRRDRRRRHAPGAAAEPGGFVRIEQVAVGRGARRRAALPRQPCEQRRHAHGHARDRRPGQCRQHRSDGCRMGQPPAHDGQRDRGDAKTMAALQVRRHGPGGPRRGRGLRRVTSIDIGPDRLRWAPVEGMQVRGQRVRIHRAVCRRVSAAGARRLVVQEAAEHLAAQRPVIDGAREVQVPGLVDVGRRTDRVAGHLGQHEKAPVLRCDGERMAQCPAVVVGEPAFEAERIIRRGESECLDAGQQGSRGGFESLGGLDVDGRLPFSLLCALLVLASKVSARRAAGGYRGKPHRGRTVTPWWKCAPPRPAGRPAGGCCRRGSRTRRPRRAGPIR